MCSYSTSAAPTRRWTVGHRLGSIAFAAPFKSVEGSIVAAPVDPSRRWTTVCPSVASAAPFGTWTARLCAEAILRAVPIRWARPWPLPPYPGDGRQRVPPLPPWTNPGASTRRCRV